MSVKDLDVLSGSLKRALDDVPVHVRQLGEMFRKHGSKQARNRTDVEGVDTNNVPSPLRDGWKKDTWTPDDVVQTPKGDRPDPASYLDQDYIDQHLDQFADGGVRFYRDSNLGSYGPGNNRGEGPEHDSPSTFIFPASELDRVMNEARSPEELGEALGLGRDFFRNADGSPADVTIGTFSPDDIANSNLRIPSGNEGGANPQWIPGGYLPNGVPEAAIDMHPDATPDDPSAGGQWGGFQPFTFDPPGGS